MNRYAAEPQVAEQQAPAFQPFFFFGQQPQQPQDYPQVRTRTRQHAGRLAASPQADAWQQNGWQQSASQQGSVSPQVGAQQPAGTGQRGSNSPLAQPASAAGRMVRASWYGGGERLSSRTASGEHFNRGGLTAAHRSLPFGTRIQVTNPHTGLAVVVRVNDRGPAAYTGNSLDLARGAAQAIGLRSTGPVKMVVLN